MAFPECFTNIAKAYPDEGRELYFFEGAKFGHWDAPGWRVERKLAARGDPTWVRAWRVPWPLNLGLYSTQHRYLVINLEQIVLFPPSLRMFGKLCEELGPMLYVPRTVHLYFLALSLELDLSLPEFLMPLILCCHSHIIGCCLLT